MEIILKYFPDLSEIQIERFRLLKNLYSVWNSKINVISRKDLPFLFEKHVLHSLAIAKFIRFKQGSRILDVGTGGGFPGIPLAILFSRVNFHLIDATGKKIKVVNSVIEGLELDNVSAEQIRAEQLKMRYDFIVSRAVTKLPEFVLWVRKNISEEQKNAIPNGVLYLKGGDIKEEINPFKTKVFVQNLSEYFEEEFFETKKLVHIIL